jgi:hypothetical protein
MRKKRGNMDTSNKTGIIDFVQFKLARNQKSFGSTTMSTNQLESLISTIRQLIQKARTNGDSCEYYRLCEELRFAEAALNARLAPPASSALALA